MSARPRVLITRRIPAVVEREAAERFDVTLNERDVPLTPEELKAALTQYDALMPTVTDRLTAEVLAAEPLRTRLLANFGVGFNHIDVDAARARGIAVANTPDVLTDATADLAMTLLLMVARRAGEGERHVRSRAWTGWRPTHMLGTQVSGKTLGLVGMGRIAKAVAKRAHHGFGMRVIYHDPFPPAPEVAAALGAEGRATVEEVLTEADFVSLHCPATPGTRHLIDAARLKLMKPSACLINTARGDVVDEAALLEALANGTIRGAGLDVFEREPEVPEGLLALENVVLLPHLGSATTETREAMGRRALENITLFFDGKPLRDRVV
ncbi:MAG: 2-hydroxyacid dehydrogenase [Gemmatimonadota bacterium]